MRPTLHFIARLLRSTLLGVVLLLGLVLGGLNLPAVQTRLAQELATRVSAKLGFPISVGRISIRWLNSLTLENVSVLDRKQEEMIRVGRLEIDFRLQHLLDSSAVNIHLDEVLLYRPVVRLAKNGFDGQLNFDKFLEAIDSLTTDPAHPGIPNHHTPFTIGKARVIDGTVSLDDPREPQLRQVNHFDENHFELSLLNANVTNLLILGDTIALNINNMNSRERQANLTVHRLQTNLLFCNTHLELADLHAQVNQSTIQDYLLLSYKGTSAFSNFNHEVQLTARLRNSELYSRDLGRFSDYLLAIDDTYRLTTDLHGSVDNLRLLDADVRFGQHERSRLVGDMTFRNLPDLSKTIAGLHYRASSVNMADTEPYYPDPAFVVLGRKLGTISFTADFLGPFDNFRTAGRFQTALGTVAGQLALHIGRTADLTTYDADLTTERLAAGDLFGEPGLLGDMNGTLRLTGHGLALRTAVGDINGQFERLTVQGHSYRNVRLNGNLQRAFFTGNLNLHDPNLTADLAGEFDLSKPQNRFDIQGTVDRADLRALGLLSDSLVIKTELDLKLEGNTLNTMVGEVQFRQAELTLDRRLLQLDSLRISSVITGDKRLLALQSSLANGWFSGTFQPDQVTTDLTRLVNEYKLYFTGSQAERQRYYAEKRRLADQQSLRRNALPPDYSIDYSIILRNTQPMLDWLAQPVFVAPQSQLDGQLRIRRVAEFRAMVRTDSLALGHYRFGRSDLDLFTSKATLGDSVLVSAVLNSDRQQFGRLTPTERLVLDANWGNGELSFNSRIGQAGSTNQAIINGDVRFLTDAIQLTFRRSQIRLLDNDWTLNPAGVITKVGNSYRLNDVSATNGAQLLIADGDVSSDSTQTLKINARQFHLATLNPLFNSRLGGRLNGTAWLHDLTGSPIVESQLDIDSLAYGDLVLGNVQGSGTWDPARQRVNIDAHLSRDTASILTVGGSYAPNDPQNRFNLIGTVTGANLNLIEPFTKGLFSNIGGTVNGQLALRGTIAKPVLTGELAIRRGRLRFDYLNSDLFFDDKIQFSDGDISVRQVTLRDAEGNIATLRGGAYHSNFRQFGLRIGADLTRFRILNTGVKDNDLFYGTAYVTGHADISGPLDNLTIRANATSNKNTRIFIPLDGARTVSSSDFIQFVNRRQIAHTDSARRDAPALDLSAIKMEFNLNVTPDAYCEIQLNRQTGDVIKSFGTGQLTMQIDTKGDFSMTGNYDISQGDYTFTFENVINKRFQIRPGSRIIWTGDPYAAQLAVTAAYTQYTSLSPLLTSVSTANNSDQSRRYPVDLLIKLNGQLQSPDISFDLKVKEYPAQSDYRQAVSAFEARLLSSEQELARQVSSMLIFNTLIPENASLLDASTAQAGAINSLSELLSNQINRLASTLSEKLDLGVSLGGFTNNSSLSQSDNLLNNLQLRFSYRFFNDRFRISRDGGFTYGQSQANATSVVGEWTLEYWITPDGRFRAKVYNRNQQSALGQYAGYGTSTLTPGGGGSILYTRTFNSMFGPSKRSKPGLLPLPLTPADSLPKPVSKPPVLTSTAL